MSRRAPLSSTKNIRKPSCITYMVAGRQKNASIWRDGSFFASRALSYPWSFFMIQAILCPRVAASRKPSGCPFLPVELLHDPGHSLPEGCSDLQALLVLLH